MKTLINKNGLDVRVETRQGVDEDDESYYVKGINQAFPKESWFLEDDEIAEEVRKWLLKYAPFEEYAIRRTAQHFYDLGKKKRYVE